MNAQLIILAIAIPMATGVLSLITELRMGMRRLIGYAGLTLNLLVALGILCTVVGQDRILVLQAADWPAPFGISLVVDGFSAIMLMAAALVLLATYAYCDEQLRDTAGGLFYPLFHLLALGVQWSLVTGDLFNLFVAFEIMLMSSYALLVLGTSRGQMRQAYKYVLLNLLASMVLVTSCGLIYGHVGTLNFADLARLSHSGAIPSSAVPAICLLLLAFGVKSALFPAWFWLPDSYPTVPAGLGAVLGGLLTKVGAYVLIRVFVMVFGPWDSAVGETVRPLLLTTAAFTMFLGVLGAVSMNSVRKILSVHIISQVGYMVLAAGLALGIGLTTDTRELAITGGIYFIVHNMIVKTSLFLCGGLMCRYAGSDSLDHMGSLAKKAPWLGVLFMLAALSLAGLPPTSGFFGKLVLLREAMHGGYYLLAAVAIMTSVLTLLSMVKIWSYAFWNRARPAPAAGTGHPEKHPLKVTKAMAATALLVVASLALGLGAEPSVRAAHQAARNVIEPSAYIDAVLGPQQIHPLRLVDAAAKEEMAP